MSVLLAAAESGITWPDVGMLAVVTFGFVAFIWVITR